MTEKIVSGIDLSKLSVKDLDKIALSERLPDDVRELATMRSMLENEGYPSEEGVDLTKLSKAWTVSVSPRTEGEIRKMIGQK